MYQTDTKHEKAIDLIKPINHGQCRGKQRRSRNMNVLVMA